MDKFLNQFKQGRQRAWVWFIIVVLSVFSALFALAAGIWLSVINNLIFAAGAYWIDKLEKAVTKNNLVRCLADSVVLSEVVQANNNEIAATIVVELKKAHPDMLTLADETMIKSMISLRMEPPKENS